jgi:glutaredoxin
VAACVLVACRPGKSDEPRAAKQQRDDWRQRVDEAHEYGERRKKEWTPVPIQSAIGVEVKAGAPNAGVKAAGATGPSGAPRTATAPEVTVVRPSDVSSEDLLRLGERARNAVGVTVYTAAWCGICGMAREHMRERRIAFVERDVGVRADWKKKLVALNPRATVPTFDIDGLVMIGFRPEPLDELIARARDARLARLLQGPKTILVSTP